MVFRNMYKLLKIVMNTRASPIIKQFYFPIFIFNRFFFLTWIEHLIFISYYIESLLLKRIILRRRLISIYFPLNRFCFIIIHYIWYISRTVFRFFFFLLLFFIHSNSKIAIIILLLKKTPPKKFKTVYHKGI